MLQFAKIVKGALKLFVRHPTHGKGARERLQAAAVAAAQPAGPALPLAADAKGGKEL